MWPTAYSAGVRRSITTDFFPVRILSNSSSPTLLTGPVSAPARNDPSFGLAAARSSPFENAAAAQKINPMNNTALHFIPLTPPLDPEYFRGDFYSLFKDDKFSCAAC